jgi:CelD/BcsL family acetyltransferase involved in cellulose biosynthesis
MGRQSQALTVIDMLDPNRRSSMGGVARPLSRAIGGMVRSAGARAECIALDAAAPLVDSWRDLAGRALEPNVFYEPAFALAAAPAFGDGVCITAVWSPADPARLIGLFPTRRERRRFGLGPALTVGWTHSYAPLGVPLIDRHEAPAAIAAWLDFMAACDAGPILLPSLPIDGAFVKALRETLATRGGRAASFDSYRRALLAPAADRSGYLDEAVPSKKRKELARQRRRLSDRAELVSRISSGPSAIADALDEFMTLEAAGWKGRAGTAAAHHPRITSFMRQAVGALAADAQAQVMRLEFDGLTAAAAIVLRSGDTAWFWKITYDEKFAHASPGVQIALDVTRALLDEPTVARADSCATPDHAMIDRLWRERLAIADFLIAPSDKQPVRFVLIGGLEHTRRALIRTAKWARAHLRGR